MGKLTELVPDCIYIVHMHMVVTRIKFGLSEVKTNGLRGFYLALALLLRLTPIIILSPLILTP